MAEDKANISSNADIGEKPKRTRKRKIETDKMSEQAFQVAANMQQADVSVPADVGTPLPEMPAVELQLAEIASDNAAAPVAASLIYSGCGGALKAAREAQGLSIHEVSSQLRLGINQIQAIEQDQFDQLPQQSIVRGFIRNYAKLLKVEVEPILAAYQHLVPSEAPVNLSVKSTGITPTISHSGRTILPKRLLAWLGLVILLVISAYFYISHIKPHGSLNLGLPLKAESTPDSTSEAVALPESTTLTPLPAPLPEAAPIAEAPAAPVTASEPPVAVPSLPAPAAPVASSPAAALPTPVSSAALTTQISTPTPAVEGSTGMTTLKATHAVQAELTFRVREDSWVRIEDAQGKKIFSEVLTAGSERALSADKPLTVTVGNAAATQLSIDHQSYDLTQATRGRVARIQLK